MAICRNLDLAHEQRWLSAVIGIAPDRHIWYHRSHHIVLDGFGHPDRRHGPYLYRATGTEDMVIGISVTARHNDRMRRVPAMAANALPLRLAMRAELPVEELIREVGRQMRQLLRHQSYRYEHLNMRWSTPGSFSPPWQRRALQLRLPFRRACRQTVQPRPAGRRRCCIRRCH